ncbi:POC1 centriolar protein homolog [Teleopsis dalmanni]|uniref:POC1 centriolar protein homolog n=1 Tax=Teleopsis dalmanni TaxID=139649 RepID=UPI0018CDE678|nr:POC1 centriolar protein homolog [Teleopsis dalmanni]
MAANTGTYLEPILQRHFTGHIGAISSIRFNINGDQIATASTDASVILWDLKQAARCIRFGVHTGPVHGVSWSSNLIASTGQDRTVKIWEPKIRGVSCEFIAHCKTVRSVDFDPTGMMLITASDDKSVKLWKVAQRKFLTSFAYHTNWVRSAKFSPNGKLIASCSDDKTLRIFDVNSGQCIRTFTEERGMGRQVAWHPTGNVVAVALSCNRVKLFDIAETELIQLYQVHSAPVNDLSFHPNGNFMLTGSDDETIKVLDLLEGRPIYTLTGHVGPVSAVSFSSDGSIFSSAGRDRKLLVWKSNLHTFDFSQFQAKVNETTCSKNALNTSASDQSILIDPRGTNTYNEQDENLQVLDGINTEKPHDNDGIR